MRYLFDVWDKIEKELNKKYIFLFLDYDGTLAPIAKTPQQAILPIGTKELLRRLSECRAIKLAIVSGRSLSDIKRMAGLDGIIYVGNHGLEIAGPKIKFKSPLSPRYRSALDQIRDDLNAKFSGIKGVFVEDKGLSLSIHYRLADEKQASLVKTLVHEVAIFYLVRGKIKIRPGKKVIEIRPPVEWDKGKVVLWLLCRQKFALKNKDIFPIYIGDDLTDEDAFRALKDIGITIFVGKPKKSYAQYYLRDTKEVKNLLARLLGYYRKTNGYARIK